MRVDPARAARWRERAEEYRICADACTTEGAKLAYYALADCADTMAVNIEHGTLVGAVRAGLRPSQWPREES